MNHHHHSDRQSNTTAIVVVVAVVVGVQLVTLTLALVALGGFLYFRLATDQSRDEAARARVENNLKQVEMAVRQYEAATAVGEQTQQGESGEEKRRWLGNYGKGPRLSKGSHQRPVTRGEWSEVTLQPGYWIKLASA